MTDLSQLAARQQPPQQQGIPPQLGMPVGIAVEPVQVPGGAGMVAVQVQNVHGAFVFGMDGKGAIEVGKRLMAAGRAAVTGLTLIGDVGGGE